MPNIIHYTPEFYDKIIPFFANVFTISEGDAEGKTINALITNLLDNTASQDIQGFLTLDNKSIIAGVFFTRLSIEENSNFFLLSPMAVSTAKQAQGYGQALLKHAIKQFQNQNVDGLLTYGDPAFYQKVGFEPIDETKLKAPYPLSMPHGWLGLGLHQNIHKVMGKVDAVTAFQSPALW